MTVAIIDYESGNLHSACKAIEKVAANTAQRVVVTADPEALRHASHIVLPGVGAFGDCIRGLRAIDGMVEALEERVLQAGVPFLGICVGMQLMLERGLEYGVHAGLGWIKGQVEVLQPSDSQLKIPHMGWNELALGSTSHPVLRGLQSGDHAYFVHSFHARCEQASDVLATVDYGGPINACIGRDNMLGTQFHPEKSQRTGLQLLENFIRWM